MYLNNNAAGRYASVNLTTNIESASPHRIILMLIDGAIEKIRIARSAMQQGKIADKGSHISWTISIIDGLRASLNIEKGGEVAINLDRLYEYMARTLTEANLHNDEEKLNTVEKILCEIRAGWKGIEQQVEHKDKRVIANEIGPHAVGVG